MKNLKLVKNLIVLAVLSTSTLFSGCKKEVLDYGLCDKAIGMPFDNGKVKAKLDNDADYVRGENAAKALGYADGKAKALKVAYQNGYVTGYNTGYGETYSSGYYDGGNWGDEDGAIDGFNDGKIIGYNDGFDAGEADGYEDGYSDGYSGDSCGVERKIPVKPTDDQCFNQGYSEIRNAQASYNSGYGAALAVNAAYQQGYNEWINDRTSYNQGRIDGYPVGRADGYNEGYTKGYSDAYDAAYDYQFTRGFDIGWDDGYYDGYSVGYDRGYSDGEADSCTDKHPLDGLRYRASTNYSSLLTTQHKTAVGKSPYKSRPLNVNKLFAGMGKQMSSLKGHSKITESKIFELRKKAATSAWNKRNQGDWSKAIPKNASYIFKKY